MVFIAVTHGITTEDVQAIEWLRDFMSSSLTACLCVTRRCKCAEKSPQFEAEPRVCQFLGVIECIATQQNFSLASNKQQLEAHTHRMYDLSTAVQRGCLGSGYES